MRAQRGTTAASVSRCAAQYLDYAVHGLHMFTPTATDSAILGLWDHHVASLSRPHHESIQIFVSTDSANKREMHVSNGTARAPPWTFTIDRGCSHHPHSVSSSVLSSHPPVSALIHDRTYAERPRMRTSKSLRYNHALTYAVYGAAPSYNSFERTTFTCYLSGRTGGTRTPCLLEGYACRSCF